MGKKRQETTMSKNSLTFAAILIVGTSATAFAAAPAQKLSQAECDSLWMQANPSNSATISEAQAKSYVTDFKAANPDNDGSLDKSEFAKACKSGLVRGSGSSGAGAGDAGSSSGDSSR
jgi:flavin-binding protein dodecin